MNISPTITRFMGDVALQTKKHAPAILTGIGITSVVAATVLAAKNTLKLESTIDKGQAALVNVNDLIEQGEVPEKARTAVYVRNVASVAKLYLLPGTLLVGGVVCILGGQHILNQRNAALAAAYNGLAASYKAYRGRVAEELGEEREAEIYRGEKTITEEDPTTGKKVKKKVLVDGEHVGSPYRFVYDIGNPNWVGFHDENLFRLTVAQNMFNDLLKARGHVLLHEVLDTLGFERTPASIVTGWKYDPENPAHKGDNFVEFNIRDYQSEHGYILLDFNVDGTIFDNI